MIQGESVGQRLFFAVAIAFITVGGALLSWYMSPFRPQVGTLSQQVVFRVPENTIRYIRQGSPERIRAPRLGVDLPVALGAYNAELDEWTLSYDRAYHANLTVPTNDYHGTTLIYGHNRRGLFAELHQLQPNDIVEVYTDSGYIFKYRFHRHKLVSPRDTHVLRQNTSKPTLVLQTCEGGWSEQRKLFYFQLEDVFKEQHSA